MDAIQVIKYVEYIPGGGFDAEDELGKMADRLPTWRVV